MSPRLGGWTVSADVGWRVNQHWQIGADFRSWLNGLKADDSLPGFYTGTALLSYYPRIPWARGLFVEGTRGFSWYEMTRGSGDPLEPVPVNSPTYASGNGSAYTIGLGWEGRQWITARLTYVHGEQRSIHAGGDGTVATGWRQRAVFVEAGVRGVLPRPWRNPQSRGA
jgi:hypothetical protein